MDARFTQLRNGMIVLTEALEFIVELEARGLACASKDGKLFVTPPGQLTAYDKAMIASMKFHLLELASHAPHERL
jgi:hypothetical protein